ncbi:hypothetical protein AB832_06310 [Flavobacteriaceae bacterium (ex Bugula neritina AB1)]|nr:hypothetical protein AB832_06310 [Flavobacteriaceae bacterium (ex Bugula neritina AB1)]
MTQQFIKNVPNEYILKNIEVKDLLMNIMLNMDNEIFDVTSLTDFSYEDGITNHKRFLTVQNSAMYPVDNNDPLANAVPFVNDQIDVALETFDSKKILNVHIRDKFSFLDVISDIMTQHCDARLLSMNNKIINPIITSSTTSTPIPNSKATTGIELIDTTTSTTGVISYEIISDALAGMLDRSVKSTGMNLMLDPMSYSHLRKDQYFKNMEYVGRSGAVLSPILRDHVLGINYVQINPRYLYPDGDTSKDPEVQNRIKEDQTNCYGILMQEDAVISLEGDYNIGYQDVNQTHNAEIYGSYHSFGVGYAYPRAISVIKSLKKKK